MFAYRTSSIFARLVAIATVSFVGQAVFAQPGGPARFGSDPGLRLLASKQVQHELELVDDQIHRINDLQSSQRDEMREMFMGMRDRFRDMDRESRRDAIQEVREELSTLNKKYVDQVKEILLPHQVTRWEQLKFQSQARRSGGADRFLESDEVAKKLNINDDQMVALKKKASEIRKSVQAKIAKIRLEAQDEILSVLTPEQQEQYRSLTGDSFNFDDIQQRGWGDWGRGRGGGDHRFDGRRDRDRRGNGDGPRDRRPRDDGPPSSNAGE